jgi:hypothetical protein
MRGAGVSREGGGVAESGGGGEEGEVLEVAGYEIRVAW